MLSSWFSLQSTSSLFFFRTGCFAIVLSQLLCFTQNDIAYAGRGDKSGTAAASELLIPVGAQSLGVAGAGLATISGLEALYWNPAGLTRSSTKTSAMFSHMSYLADIGVDYLAVGGSVFGEGYLAVAIKMLSFGDIPVTTEDQPDGTGETTSPTYLVIGATYSRRISDRITIGITSNVIYEKMAQVSASGLAFNAGVQYSGLGGIDGLNVGVVVKNIGPRLKYDGSGLFRSGQVNGALSSDNPLKIDAAAADLPSTIEIGLGYITAVNSTGELTVMSSFQNNNFSDDEYHFGCEYLFDHVFSLRGGIALAPQTDGSEYIFGPAAGIGVQQIVQDLSISVDYAYRTVKYFNGNHVFSLHLGF
jgi:hypothetical protein